MEGGRWGGAVRVGKGGEESKKWERGKGAEELYHMVGLKPERLCFTPPHPLPLPCLGTCQGS